MRKSKIYSISDEEFCKLVSESNSYSDILRALGLGTNGGSSTDILKKRIAELNCSIEHFNRKVNSKRQNYTLEEILVENSTYANITSLKRRLINEEKLEYKCALCGIDSWLGNPLSLQLDHINGVNNDHRLCNLRFLCPNCHSQTETYAGRNKTID